MLHSVLLETLVINIRIIFGAFHAVDWKRLDLHSLRTLIDSRREERSLSETLKAGVRSYIQYTRIG